MRLLCLVLTSVITFLFIHVRATCDLDHITCPSDEKYHCQFDGQKLWGNFCAEPILCEAGEHAVLHNDTKSVSCEDCAEEMFQPAGKWSNIFTQPNCDEPISPCKDLQQVVCEKATRKQNNKCACNESAGYKWKESFYCTSSCFSQDSVCECEIQSPESTPASTPSSSSISTTTATTTSPSNDDTALKIALPILSVVIIGVVGGCLYCRRKHSSFHKKEDNNENRDTADGLLSNEGAEGDMETGTVDSRSAENAQGRQKTGDVHDTRGLTGNSRANKVYAAHSVDGGIGHGFGIKGDAANRRSNSNTRSKEHQDRTINVVGVRDQATVDTANVAGIVEGGMGHRNNSGGNAPVTDGGDEDHTDGINLGTGGGVDEPKQTLVMAPIAPPEDTNV